MNPIEERDGRSHTYWRKQMGPEVGLKPAFDVSKALIAAIVRQCVGGRSLDRKLRDSGGNKSASSKCRLCGSKTTGLHQSISMASLLNDPRQS